MFRRFITKLGKITGATATVTLGVWACAHETSRPLVTDAVTNARLIEVYAPADGKLNQLVERGAMFATGQDLARTTTMLAAGLATTDGDAEHKSYDIAAATSDMRYPFGVPSFHAAGDTAPVHLLDRDPVEDTIGAVTANMTKLRSTETPLVAETSGMVWNWRRASGGMFTTGENVGYIAECTNLLAMGQIAFSNNGLVRVGDPIVFATRDAQWTGSVQQIMGGVPNQTGLYAIQFPAVNPDSMLVIYSLDVPIENQQTCALGVSGQIQYPLDARKSPQDYAGTLLADTSGRLTRAKAYVQSVFENL